MHERIAAHRSIHRAHVKVCEACTIGIGHSKKGNDARQDENVIPAAKYVSIKLSCSSTREAYMHRVSSAGLI